MSAEITSTIPKYDKGLSWNYPFQTNEVYELNLKVSIACLGVGWYKLNCVDFLHLFLEGGNSDDLNAPCVY